MTLNVNLTPRLEDMVRQKVAGGLYNNASEVIREALRLMEAQDRLLAARVEAMELNGLREDLIEGLNSGSAGQLDVDVIKQRGLVRLSKGQR